MHMHHYLGFFGNVGRKARHPSIAMDRFGGDRIRDQRPSIHVRREWLGHGDDLDLALLVLVERAICS